MNRRNFSFALAALPFGVLLGLWLLWRRLGSDPQIGDALDQREVLVGDGGDRVEEEARLRWRAEVAHVAREYFVELGKELRVATLDNCPTSVAR